MVRIGLDLLSALEYAHGLVDSNGKPLGIVHRDISPENVLLTFAGRAMLLDFGIAKARTRQVRTSTGVVKGKFAYMAPEQAEADEVDARADLWSLGVLLWELFAGRRLFAASSQFASLTSSMLGVIPKLDETVGLPTELSDVVARALQRDRSLRYESASAMAEELERALGAPAASKAELATFLRDRFPTEIARDQSLVSVALPDEPAPAEAASRAVEAPSPRRGRRAAALLALATVGILGATAIVVHPSEPPAEPLVPRSIGSEAVTEPPPSRPTSLPPTPSIEPARATEPPAEPPRPEPEPAAAAGASRERSLEARPTATAPTPRAASTPAGAGAPAAMAEAEAVAPSDTGRLSLVSVPWSRVELDGRFLGNTPLVRIELPVGTHVLLLTNTESGLSMRYPVSIEAGRTTVRRVALGP